MLTWAVVFVVYEEGYVQSFFALLIAIRRTHC